MNHDSRLTLNPNSNENIAIASENGVLEGLLRPSGKFMPPVQVGAVGQVVARSVHQFGLAGGRMNPTPPYAPNVLFLYCASARLEARRAIANKLRPTSSRHARIVG